MAGKIKGAVHGTEEIERTDEQRERLEEWEGMKGIGGRVAENSEKQ